jgi:signal transduction histidine kinase
MVQSLQTLNADLRSEITERLQVEAEVRALNLTLEQRVADRTRELSALYEVSAAANRAMSLDALLAETLKRTLLALRAEAGAIYALDHQQTGMSLQLKMQHGLAADWLSRLTALLVDGELAREIIEQREPLLIPDVTSDPRTVGLVDLDDPTCLLIAPLQSGEQAIGVFGLIRKTGPAFNIEEVALLATLADQLSGAIENDRLRQVAQHASVLAERERLARDLHDSVTQSLYGLILLTEAGQFQLESGANQAVKHTLSRLDETARQTIREMRLYIYQLRPLTLEQDGLMGALHKRLAAVEGRTNIQTRLLADDGIHLPLPVEATLYQIVQEALNNSLRHAHATTVTVYLRHEADQVILEIMDDGCGFDLGVIAPGGMGLSNMQQRAEQIGGKLKITSVPGTGTRIKVSLSEIIA